MMEGAALLGENPSAESVDPEIPRGSRLSRL